MQQTTDVQIETQGLVPVMTLVVIFCMVTVFAVMCQHRLEFWSTHIQALNWAQNSASVQAVNVATWIRDQNLQRLLGQLALASLSSLTGWQLAANCYFTWLFGSTVEQKLGAGRYVMLCLMAMYVPYAVIAWDSLKIADASYYFGPVYLIVALIGAGMVFPEEKKARIWFKKTRGEIFQRGSAPDPRSKFKVNVVLFSMVFVGYQAGVWYYTGKFMPDFKSFHLMGIFAGLVLGYGLAWFLVWSATGDLREGPIKLMCIRKYNEVLKLDVGHEAAVRTTSMALGLPEERVREWVAKQRGKMRIT
jgi:membrane associated rhomboid family serine protease